MFFCEFNKHFIYKIPSDGCFRKKIDIYIWIFLQNRDLQKVKKVNVNHIFSLVCYKIKEFYYSLLKQLTKHQFLTARSIELKFHVIVGLRKRFF